MARSRHTDNIPSHRPGGRRTKLVVAPWIIISLVAAVVLSGATVGYVLLAISGCSGEQVRTTIVAAPEISRVLDTLGRQWLEEEPAVDGRCAAVEVVSRDSAEIAVALGPDWDPRRHGPQPDVWIPESTAWLRLASADPAAAAMIPTLQPSLARSPTVIAVPAPMAETLGWPDTGVSWQDLATTLPGSSWAERGHPEWGDFRLGMGDPATSTADLHAVMAVADPDDDGEVTTAERAGITALSAGTTVHTTDTDALLSDLIGLEGEDPETVLTHVSAFPALERDVLDYNASSPRVPLAAFYPGDGSADADYPYLTLDAPWSVPEEVEAAGQFLDFVRGDAGTAALLEAGFRDSQRQPGPEVTAENGTLPEIAALPRAALSPEQVTASLGTWIGATRPANVLLAVDTSESMEAPAEGTDTGRLELAGTSAAALVGLLGDQARVALWEFASGEGGDGEDHRQVVTPGPLGEEADGGDDATRRDLVGAELEDLEASGEPELYDTVLAAYTSVQNSYVPDALNLVVVFTGGDHTDGAGLNRDGVAAQLEQLADPERPVRVVVIGYGGPDSAESLAGLAALTGGLYHQATGAEQVAPALVEAAMSL